MNQQQKQVIDNTSLVGFIGSRPFFPESDSRGLNSLRLSEKGGQGGSVGTGIHNGNVSGWARATSKPFGKAKPGELGCINSRMPECKEPVVRDSQPIRSLRNIKPLVAEPVTPQPQAIVCVCGNGFDKDEHAVKVAEKIRQVSLRMDNFVKDKVLSKAEPSLEGVVVNKKEHKFKPAIVGLDKVRKGKRETVPAWEREKQERSDLILYALTLRSLYRLIYGG